MVVAISITMVYTPYTYLLVWTEQNKAYYGARYARTTRCLYESGCHPDDLLVTYNTSSKPVHDMISKYGMPDIKQVRKTFSTADDCIAWESKVLQKMGVVHDDKWLNLNDSKFIAMNADIAAKIGKSNAGKQHSDETKQKISMALKGREFSTVHRERIGTLKSVEQKGKGNSKWAPFVLVVNLPCGDVEEYLFDSDTPKKDLAAKFGLDSTKMKKGYIVKKVNNVTKHPWPKETAIKVRFLD